MTEAGARGVLACPSSGDRQCLRASRHPHRDLGRDAARARAFFLRDDPMS